MGILKKIIGVFYLFLVSLVTSVLIVLNGTFIYKLSINIFNIVEKTNVSKENLIEDYNRVINYIRNPFINDFSFNNFKMSAEGKFHFYEVKEIIIGIEILFIILLILGIIFFLLNKRNVMKFPIESFKYTFNVTIGIFLGLLAAIYSDFNSVFNKFHSIFFNNDYWIFDPDKDPIIKALPEEYFMLCAVIIIFLTVLFTFGFKIIYRKLNNKRGSVKNV